MVPQSVDLREEILREFHWSRFSVHPGGTEMYHDFFFFLPVLLECDEETR